MKTTADFKRAKKLLIKKLEQTNDEVLIHAIQNLIDFARKKDEEYLGETIEEYNLALDKANTEIDNGNFLTHKQAIKLIGEWRKKRK